ncbi:hypothetical protein [Halorubrum sp. SD626R]|uniref:hypothetical protein n=1 Tax=Halorubrum sp. SD626R TaxID=1419722 RepID=UPI0013054435|nr:hypothetical protein [Halorubrum sp. SD626R]
MTDSEGEQAVRVTDGHVDRPIRARPHRTPAFPRAVAEAGTGGMAAAPVIS